jgi:hypothetical protein
MCLLSTYSTPFTRQIPAEPLRTRRSAARPPAVLPAASGTPGTCVLSYTLLCVTIDASLGPVVRETLALRCRRQRPAPTGMAPLYAIFARPHRPVIPPILCTLCRVRVLLGVCLVVVMHVCGIYTPCCVVCVPMLRSLAPVGSGRVPLPRLPTVLSAALVLGLLC